MTIGADSTRKRAVPPRRNVRQRAHLRPTSLALLDCRPGWVPMVMLCTEGASYYGYEAAIFGEAHR
jgi:hypothetical protein